MKVQNLIKDCSKCGCSVSWREGAVLDEPKDRLCDDCVWVELNRLRVIIAAVDEALEEVAAQDPRHVVTMHEEHVVEYYESAHAAIMKAVKLLSTEVCSDIG